MTRLDRQQSGFTLVELVMAMAIFSVMFLMVVNGFIIVTHLYDAGITTRTTQQNARLVIDDFVKNAHYSGRVDVSHSPQACLFTGSKTIVYVLNGNGNLWRNITSGSACPVMAAPTAPVTPAPGAGWQQLNDSTVKVAKFEPTVTAGLNGGQGTVSLKVTMVARSSYDLPNSLFDPVKNECLSGANGFQYCSVASLATTVYLNGGGN